MKNLMNNKKNFFRGSTRQLQGFLANFALFKSNIHFFCNIEFPTAAAIRFFLQKHSIFFNWSESCKKDRPPNKLMLQFHNQVTILPAYSTRLFITDLYFNGM